MSAVIRGVVLMGAVLAVGIMLASGPARPQTADTIATVGKGAQRTFQRWTRVAVEQPTSQSLFPAGNGSDIANGQCLICHSSGMVLRQPPLTLDQWRGEINKMRNSYGAPLPADQIEAVARYLYSIDGSQAPADRAVLDEHAS